MISDSEGKVIPIQISDIPSSNLFVSTPPEKLFHYTNYEGAKGIIESKSIWLTKLAYLNDRSELKLAIELFQEKVHSLSQKLVCAETISFLEETAKQLESFSSTNICVASFCEDGDLLSQWRSYGNNGSGVAMVFNSDLLNNLAKNNSILLCRCIYSSVEQALIIEELIKQLIASFDKVRSFENPNVATLVKTVINQFTSTFLSIAPIIKNKHFQEEKEWRLITKPIKHDDKNWFPRITNAKVSEYFKLNFDLPESGPLKILNGLNIGPALDQELVAKVFFVLLSKSNYAYNRILFSQIPYKNN